MKIGRVISLFVIGLPLLISACRPYHATPFDALTEWPGKLENKNVDVLNSVQVLAEQEVAGGLVLLYSVPTEEAGQNILASTFVTPDVLGWRSQSTGSTNYSDSDDFAAAYFPGGNVTDLTTAYGISLKGDRVRIRWSDGQTDVLLLENPAFILARPETLTVRSIEILDSEGLVLEKIGE
jgi:hypothetical protein